MPYREKNIFAGQYRETEIYFVTASEVKQSRKKKTKESLPKQKNLNLKNSRKHLTRLINANFTADDLHLTLTYKNQPETDTQAKKDVENFIRRLKYRRKKQGLPELKYITVVEQKDKDGRKVRLHHHVILSGDMPRDEIEKVWKLGRCNASRLQPDECGLSGLANYITKNTYSGKRWAQSQNLIQPKVTVNDHKYSRKKLAKIFEAPSEREIEALYEGYFVSRIEQGINDITGTMYMNIMMRKKE